MDRRRIGEQQRRAVLEAAALRQAVELRRAQHQLLDQPAMARHRDHPVARRPVGDALTHRFDHAGDLAARRERPGWLELVAVLDDQHVGIVDRAGAHANQYLAFPDLRIGHLFQA